MLLLAPPTFKKDDEKEEEWRPNQRRLKRQNVSVGFVEKKNLFLFVFKIVD